MSVIDSTVAGKLIPRFKVNLQYGISSMPQCVLDLIKIRQSIKAVMNIVSSVRVCVCVGML